MAIAFKPKIAAVVLVSVLAVSGCAAQDGTNPTAPNGEQPVTAGSAETSTATPQDITVLDAVEASYQKWLSAGMTEEVTSSGDRYVLTYEPGEPFLAALYNLELEDVIPIEQPELFTVYSAWLMLQDDATTLVEGGNQLTLTNENYGDFTVFIEDGLIVSGEAVDGSWTGVFRYTPDRAVLDLLAAELGAQ